MDHVKQHLEGEQVIMFRRVRRLRLGEHGATSVEYALMATFIAVAIAAFVATFGQKVASLFVVNF